MNEFRQALDAHAGGQLGVAELVSALTLGLTRQPQLAAAHSAYIEAFYRSGRLSGETYATLVQAVRTFQESQAPAPEVAAPPSSPQPTGDKTQFRAPAQAAAPASPSPTPSASDATQFRAPRAAAPANAGAREPTGTGSAHITGNVTGRGAVTGTGGVTGSRPTGSNWSDPNLWASDSASPTSGSIVKDRFVLEEVLGRGGMGVVFKARDLRKEEAQDRNPYVALKLLNDEFRRHPESLKALQRESRKAQQLAHANVVTVYDFDRDGANVFMVMELLEGQSLDRVIREHEETGLPIERALRLTRDLCRAMAYAHEKGVVHSDFKPANAFLTNNDVVKVFDFGIARAAKRADNVSGSTTLFDPGTLGALTPTYASCEMIEGLEPDPRDDVYAIACVAYELVSGKHPFNRLSAVQARDKQMVAKRPRGLKRHQWKALQRGLAFERNQRTESAQQFLNELLPRKRRAGAGVGIGAAVIAVLVVAGTLTPGYLAKRRERGLIDALAKGDSAELDAVVLQLQALTPEQRAAIMLNDRARTGLINVFENRINAATDPSSPNVDYARARALLVQLQSFLPDSLAVKDLDDRLVARENDEIKRLSDQFDDYLKRGLLIDVQGTPNIGTVLAALRGIDSENRLLRDPRLPGAFVLSATKALNAKNAALAEALVTAGLLFDPEDAMLADLRDQAVRAASEQQLATRAQALEASLGTLLAGQARFADIEGKRAEIDELRAVAPNSAVLARILQLAEREVREQSALLATQGQHAQALDLVARNADLVSTAFVNQQREQLASAPGAAAQRDAAVAQIKSKIDALVQGGAADPKWGQQIELELRRLAVYVPSTDPYVVQVKTHAADAYIEQARELREAHRLAEAGRMLDQARAYAPKLAALSSEQKLLAEARTAREAAAQERSRLAQLEALKHKLLLQARANDVTEALASFAELRENLPKSDAYLADEAPQAIGGAYLRLASIAAKEGRYANAMTLTTRAGEVAPSMMGINEARDRFTRYQALDKRLQSASDIDVDATRSELERLARLDAAESAAVKQRLAGNLIARIRTTSDAAQAERLTKAAREIFAGEAILESLNAPKDSAPPNVAPTTPNVSEESATTAASGQTAGAQPQTAPAKQDTQRVAAVRPGNSVGEVAVPRTQPEIACSAQLAGYGRRRQAVCYDTLDGGGRGPDLVVIPAGDGNAKVFALGRTEVSIADYSLYCERTGACKPPDGSADRPVTSISLEDAQNYVAWLSSNSGAVYRLPTDAEWSYAVNAQGGSADVSSVNCSVEIGGKKVRGVALEPVQSGKSNGWGLYNYLGNAQELVVGDSFIAARGGSFSDNVSACAPGSSRPHTGAADAVTGLRVVREIG
ncbi:MAG TPA: bifunctional serine/threonine-protein kinase/formylglycine-generating enzyme family protein [Steroidobacter sp.]|uniref:bifunctional serine/threonine-protein kinase/formylglycine-generating enzyme family protein n=1 Tax=Steroidobacter sp. TaxID=1978227 RepID=UPI002ED8962B